MPLFPPLDNGPVALMRIKPLDGEDLLLNEEYGNGAIRNYIRASDIAGFSLNQAVTATGASLAIDYVYGNDVSLTLGATVTSLTFLNWPITGLLGKILLEITNTGAFNISPWPGTTVWNGGTIPTVTSGAGKKDTFLLTSNNGGVTFRGYAIAQNMS